MMQKKHHTKVLFILKKRKLYDSPSYTKTIHSGLYNSARFVSDMLNKNGIESHYIQVIDNNDIDREVTKYKPTHVIIEALWVVPEKFNILHKLHPKVEWIIRLHSEIPFIANEGIAMDWIFEYSEMSNRNNLTIAPNTMKMVDDLKSLGVKNLLFLPNYYPVHDKKHGHHHEHHRKNHVDIGCFGAIRPMKNQLIQAIAAIEFGDRIDKSIHFHINTERVEHGDNVLRNIKSVFKNQTRHKLVEHPWYPHEEFTKIISGMDLGLQVSFNETFNIVAADFVAQDVPVIGSDEIGWLHCLYKAKPTSADDIVRKLRLAYNLRKFNIQKLNKKNLIELSHNSENVWVKYFKKR